MQAMHEALRSTGGMLASDGWTDQRKRTLLNICVNSHKGTFFMKAVDTSGELKVTDLGKAIIKAMRRTALTFANNKDLLVAECGIHIRADC
jgi:hypothetical protein